MTLSSRLRVPRILWGALLFSTVLYLVVLAQVRAAGGVAGPPDPALVYALMGMAGVVAVVSELLPRRLYALALRRKEFVVTQRPIAGADAPLFRNAASSGAVFADPAEVVRGSLAPYQTTF